ncbi:MAG: ATP-binding protein [Ferruginibacter sp.]
MEKITGRDVEQGLLTKILQSAAPELVAVYGRRRVGKTFLIRNAFEKQLVFEFSGIHNALLEQQLENFSIALSGSAGLPLAKPTSWIQAFQMLTDYLTPIIKRQRKVIFFDEFPWISTPRSGFIPAFENFWNMWGSRQQNLVIVICGSAAAWMIQKIINNRGGLHNRVTRKIRLLPFTIGETEAFLKERKINLDKYQVLQLYMVMGGIPQYLKEIETGESAIQAIDRTCFTKDGLLYEEFKNLFHSLFDDAGDHMAVVRALAKKGIGLTRNGIIEACKLTSGGGTTQLLEELTESGFISPYIPFDKAAKDSIYKLTDEYSHFYVKFIENSRFTGAGAWAKFTMGTSWKSWSGIAFESICMKHVLQLKRALGIEGVHTEVSVWRSRPQNDAQGAQIDLLIDRQDQCINICEMKFAINEYEISKGYANELENKMKVFRSNTQTRKTLFLTMITTQGVKNLNSYPGLVQNEIKMDALFK